MKNLVLDIGNLRIMPAFFEGDEFIEGESFDSLAKDHIFVVPNLVLIGLNCILNHHVA